MRLNCFGQQSQDVLLDSLNQYMTRMFKPRVDGRINRASRAEMSSRPSIQKQEKSREQLQGITFNGFSSSPSSWFSFFRSTIVVVLEQTLHFKV